MHLSNFKGKVYKNIKNTLKLGRNGLKILKLHQNILSEYQHICRNICNKVHDSLIEIGDLSKYKGETSQKNWLNFLDNIGTLRHRELKNYLVSWTRDIERFARITIMKYESDHVFPEHIDKRYSDKNDKIAMITVDGTAKIIFRNPAKEEYCLDVEPGDVVIIRNEMRYKWTHELRMGNNGRTAIIMRNLRFQEEIEKEYDTYLASS